MDFLERLAPEPRRRIKLALRALADGNGDRHALREHLGGYNRLRIGGYRVIFRHLPGNVIECVFAEVRSFVYELFEREMLERLRREDVGGSGRGESKMEESQSKYRAKARKQRRVAASSLKRIVA